jgi:LysM domain-containing protein
VGMRFASAPERSARAYAQSEYAGRSTKLPSLMDEDDARNAALWGALHELDIWENEAGGDEPDREDDFLALPAPERAETLDFTGILQTVPRRPARRMPMREVSASAPVIIRPQRQTQRPAHQPRQQPAAPFVRHVRHATVRLAELGAARPVVRIPGRGSRRDALGASAPRQTKLPPVWLLANLVILVFTGLAVIPRILPVDAAAGCQWHYVAPGDTLGNLGWAHHTTALAIARANGIANPDMIYVGQRICIPLTSTAHANSAPAVPQQKQPPRYGSARGVQAFLAFALPYARRAHAETGWPVSVILAQWGLEQGWKVPGYTGFNWGNVAALPGEPTVNGIAVPGSPAAFAYASSPEAGLRYYIRVAHLVYYQRVAPAAAQNGPDGAARALGASPWDAGHYTDSGNPGSSLLSLMRVYNLYWYDTH